MSHKINDHGKNNFNKNKDEETQNELRINQLMNLVEKQTRTERHLEQHSDISSPQAIAHSKEIQNQRAQEIENLKNIIVHGKNVNVDEYSNLQRNYEFTNGYLKENADHMDNKTLERTLEKQENRKEHMNNMF